jgi:hypothetical protein
MFVIAPGHPAQIGHAIETQMNWAIGKGLYNAAKGGAKLAGNLASLGASALIDVIAACLEFAWKFLTRFFEGRWMKQWITMVQEHTRNRNNWKADPKDGVLRPRIVYDDVAFTSLFEQGCRASVCVPMLTLNSGISGDLMMFLKMFDDTGGILGQGEVVALFRTGVKVDFCRGNIATGEQRIHEETKTKSFAGVQSASGPGGDPGREDGGADRGPPRGPCDPGDGLEDGAAGERRGGFWRRCVGGGR